MACIHEDEHTRRICQKPAIADTDYCRSHVQLYRCQFEIRKAVQNLAKPFKSKPAHLCYKMPVAGSIYCPHHALIMREEPAEKERWAKKMQAAKDRKAAEREALENSPLRANA